MDKKDYKIVSAKLSREIASKILGISSSSSSLKLTGMGGIFRNGFTYGSGLVKVHIDKSYSPDSLWASTENKYPHGYIQIVGDISCSFYYKDKTINFLENGNET
ncbi:MAG: hypothetical protein ACI4MS_00515 [Candidatus Coproplasma sp.]